MLTSVSLLMVIGYSLYFSFSSYPTNCKENHSWVKCIPMILGMTGSLTVGLVIGTWMPDRLAVTTILSIVLSSILGSFIGRRFGINGFIEAQSSSLMGAMMGAMLGVMLKPNEVNIMIITMDLIFLISVFSILLGLANRQLKKKKPILKSKSASFYVFFLINVCLICFLPILQTIDTKGTTDKIDSSEHSHHH
ncbi:hypothetical protein ACIQ4Z_04685 [Peribacillus asahii]|uniref:hypothetical protein n=1 Tax=Peribacillus asahii TaxID=228899 RepID=UPI0037FDD61C